MRPIQFHVEIERSGWVSGDDGEVLASKLYANDTLIWESNPATFVKDLDHAEVLATEALAIALSAGVLR